MINIFDCKKCENLYPLDQNNFLKLGDRYDSNCIKCSEYKRCNMCFEVKTKSTKDFNMNGNKLKSNCTDCEKKLDKFVGF